MSALSGFVNRRAVNSELELEIVQVPTGTMVDWLHMSKTHKSPFRYSRVWEDHRLISAALDIQPNQDKVLCITRQGLSSNKIAGSVHAVHPLQLS